MNDSSDLIEMKEAIALLGTSQPTFYRWLREGRVPGHKVGRQWRFHREDIEAMARGEQPAEKLPDDFGNLKNRISVEITQAGGEAEEEGEAGLTALARQIFHLAILRGASGIHIESSETEGGLRFRIDGRLHHISSCSLSMQARLVQTFKTLSHCNVQIEDLPQDGRIKMELGNREIDCRCTFLPTLHGEDTVLRLLSKEQAEISLENLNLPEDQLISVREALSGPHGLILVAGPTGSGKTTTLYAMLNEVKDPGLKLISIEEPVEYNIRGVQQVQANQNRLPSGHALRAALRCDPDVLMISQLTQREQVHEVCEAAVQGNLVLTQLHCGSCLDVIERLRELEVPVAVLADSLRLIVAQRLMRKLCPDCAQSCELDEGDLAMVKQICSENGMNPNQLEQNWKKPKGCKACGGIGYRGRVAIDEVLSVSNELRGAIMSGADRKKLQEIISSEGFCNLQGQGVMRAAAGESTLRELSGLGVM